MAIRTMHLVTFSNTCGSVDFELDIDDANGLVREVRCNNTFPTAAQGSLIRESDGRVYSRTFDAGQTTLSLPTAGGNRLFGLLDGNKLRGFGMAFSSPVCS